MHSLIHKLGHLRKKLGQNLHLKKVKNEDKSKAFAHDYLP